ncbi:MAG: RNA polymerase II elongation factor [Stictis urceolatum]|nr:RNA polymerase II elongation factor [Stictis urceolata]
MDNKAIIEKREALQKAVQSGESIGVITGMLNELRKGVVAKEETLRSTKIGAVVAKLKQHKSPEVATLASSVVRKWREEVGSQRGTASGRRSVASPSGTGSPAASQSSTKPSIGSTVPPEQRNWKRDAVDVARTSQASRNNCIGLLYDGLVHLSTLPASEVLNAAAAVEQATYSGYGPEDRDSYKAKIRSLYQNLKNKSNQQLRIRVVSGEIKPDRFVKMSHEELKSAERREEDQKLETENMRLAQAPKEEKAVSTSLQCSKCHQKQSVTPVATAISSFGSMLTGLCREGLAIHKRKQGQPTSR